MVPLDPRVLNGITPRDLEAFVRLEHPDPHRILGAHPSSNAVVVRVWHPEAISARCFVEGRGDIAMDRAHPQGLWTALVHDAVTPLRYEIEFGFRDGASLRVVDPYVFLPTFGSVDEHLAAEGQHWRIYDHLGAHVRTLEGIEGVAFSVWAPNARGVSSVGTFNQWDGRRHPMRRLGQTGIWEIFVPGVCPGDHYNFEIRVREGVAQRKLDPYAQMTELRPKVDGVVVAPSRHVWRDDAWLKTRAKANPLREAMTVYEVHLGSWRKDEEGQWLDYRTLAHKLGDYVTSMGFTHIELMPVSEHPFDGSWGYQVTGYFAPTSRFGTPDDFRYMIDHLHGRGIGVILDWVPAHFPKDAHALVRYDGTCLFEHEDPRQGEHPDWGTLVFNFGRREVRNFLLANALSWFERFHIDALRVDAVASMLYLDYSRGPGEWVPNAYGGRENLEAISLMRELNGLVHGQHPGAMVIAEESTAWPAVSRPVYAGGLGFTFKWNMGWMHDTLAYFSRDPIHRRFHHNELTFGIVYAYTENFMLPLSHDEVVHLKKSLLGKMPGDRWRRFATLRSLYAFMWAHPGKKLLFMGGEIAQEREWDHDGSIDWQLLGDPMHAGVQLLVQDLNKTLRAHPALWECDVSPDGFQWIDANDSDQSIVSFVRWNKDRTRHMVCVLNATPIVRSAYRIGVPGEEMYSEIINTDSESYGGANTGNGGTVKVDSIPSHGFSNSMTVTIPALAVLWLEPSSPVQ
jgi:1,4-alpha-glucan branching enzyme